MKSATSVRATEQSAGNLRKVFDFAMEYLASMRLGPGLRRSLICFAPLAFVSQCQERPRTVPSPLVFLMISTHFTAPP